MNKNEAKHIYKVDYDLNEIFSKKGRGIRKRIIGKRRIDLTDEIIAMLPFVPSPHVVDIAHSQFDSKNDGGRLILKIRATSKTWYVIPARKKNKKGGQSIKLGDWVVKDSNYYKSDEANKSEAVKRFPSVIKDYFDEAAVAIKEGDMTIREYIESGQYKLDRETTKIKSNKIKHVEDPTLKSILFQFEPWLYFYLKDVSETWPPQFKKYWDDRYIEENRRGRAKDPSEFIDMQVSSQTQRKYYSEFNALFNICEKKGYIEKNKIDGFSSLFPDKVKKRGTTETYKFEYKDLFDFIYKNEKSKGTENGKLIVCLMAVTACRNSEIYKNIKSNLSRKTDDNGQEYFSLFVPAELCKTGEAGEGNVPIRNLVVIEKLKLHLKRNEVINSRFLFPSPTLRDSHCSDDSYRDLWQAIKVFFGLDKKARLYSLRATLGTRVAEASGIDVAANLLRDNLDTAMLYYNNVSKKRTNDAIDEVFSSPSAQIKNNVSNNNNNVEVMTPHFEGMPSSVLNRYKTFVSTISTPSPAQIYKSDWDIFVIKIKEAPDLNMSNDSKTIDWLHIVT